MEESLVPPKVRVFVWRLCHNAFPTAWNLNKRINEISPLCPRCSVGIEDGIHAIWSCPFAVNVWECMDESDCLVGATFHDGSDWVNFIFTSCGTKVVSRLMMTTWAIWNQRNWVVHGGEECLPEETVARAMVLLEVYWAANEAGTKPCKESNGRADVAWKPPSVHALKVNVDAAIFKNGGVGMGALIRNSCGYVVRAACKQMNQDLEVDLVEAKAVLFGLQMAAQCGA